MKKQDKWLKFKKRRISLNKCVEKLIKLEKRLREKMKIDIKNLSNKR
jgi:hypothetical protein